MKKFKKSLITLLSVCMVMTMMPLSVWADGTEEGTADDPIIVTTADDLTAAVAKGGYIQLGSDIDNMNSLGIEKDVTLDLAGYTLTFDATKKVGLNVKSGSTTIIDSGNNGSIEVLENNTSSFRLVQIFADATFSLKSGTLENKWYDLAASQVIANYGTLNIDGGIVRGSTGVFAFAPQIGNSSIWAGKNTVTNISDGLIDGVPCTSDSLYDGQYIGTSYGLCWYGLGVGESGAYNQASTPQNDAVQINISGGTIKGTQGLGTNASNGKWAGFTLNISGGEIIGIDSNDDAGTGMYLPAVGVTNISGNASISGSQAIRIAAGELIINGGTVTGTEALSENTDLISGGSGGTQGAIVVGKASNGYVGDIIVNISGNAVIKNSSSADTDAARPAIVVSDKNMANANYHDNSIMVTVESASIEGDVIKVSNLTPGSKTQDGGDTTLKITGASVSGDIINRTKEGSLEISNAEVSGDVVNGGTDSKIVISDSTVGIVKNESTGTVAVLGNSKYNDTENDEGGTIYIEGQEEASIEAVNTTTFKQYYSLQEAINEAEDGETIRLVNDVILDVPDGTSENTGAINISGKNITIDGNGKTITAGNGFSMKEQWEMVNGKYHMINIMGGSNVTIKNLTVNGGWNAEEDSNAASGSAARSGINVYTADGSTDKSSVVLENVTVKNCSVYGVVSNCSDVTATDLTTTGNRWGVNVENRSNGTGEFIMNSVTINEEASIVIEGTSGGATSTIIDGTFMGSVGLKGAPETALSVAGGTFANPVLAYTIDELKYELNNDGTYTYHNTLDDVLKADGASAGTITVKPNKNVDESEEPLTLTLKYSDSESYTLKIAANDGIILPEPTRSGYKFQGWSDGEKAYQAGDTVTITEDITLTAQWSRNSSGGGGSSTPTYSVTAPSNVENGTVAVSPKNAAKDKDVTITVKPNEGYEVENVKVTDRDGKEIALTDNGDGTYTFKMPASSVSVSASFKKKAEVHVCPADKFTDVDQTLWYHEGIDYVIEKGMMNGTSSTTFAPNADTTRGMIVTILYRLEGSPAVASAAGFSDVAAGQYYADAVAWASANGIVTGYDSSKFGPNDKITREQMAAILYRYAGFKKYDVSKTSDLSSYTDNASISSYAADALKWANAEGLINGMGDGRIAPQGSAVRAQAAALLMRFCENVTK